jgi:hypothetical protein
MNARIPYLYEHLRKTESKKFYPTDIEIDEVTTRATLSTGISPPTKKIFHLPQDTKVYKTRGFNSDGFGATALSNHPTTGWLSCIFFLAIRNS